MSKLPNRYLYDLKESHQSPYQKPQRAAKFSISAMTANVLPQDRRACHEAGMNSFISKPISMEEIKNSLAGRPNLDGQTEAA
ncbi:MAG: CheY-like chemotaxis protein [Verrucomicrobiales bacterium]|jgi:CheY-like chemotaxis protein